MRLLPPDIILDAQFATHLTGVPTSVTLAQGIDESAWFTKEPVGSNNYFGIKQFDLTKSHVMSPTHEVINGITKLVLQPFAKYGTIAEGFVAHGLLLANDKRYAKAMANINNPLAFADALQGVYATDENYSQKIKTLIIDEHLLQYDVSK